MLGFGYREEKNEPEAVFIQEALALLQDKIALVSFIFLVLKTGIYILQNTLVGGGGEWGAGEKNENGE